MNFFIWFNFAVVGSLFMYVKERDAAKAPVVMAGEPPPWMRTPMRVAPNRPGPLPVPAHAKA